MSFSRHLTETESEDFANEQAETLFAKQTLTSESMDDMNDMDRWHPSMDDSDDIDSMDDSDDIDNEPLPDIYNDDYNDLENYGS